MVEPSELNHRHMGRSFENIVALGLSLIATLGFGAFCLFYIGGFITTAA
ncbi:hypothetical protein AEAC466_14475 [Asticcacaulis sp. AC466]|nr:hypothetical protein [Asticcacaulis sp. AC466]ESQ83065.1 hypothetical protein AEAC466_14475 [Asticcacaulis sp. AC466]